MRIAIAANSGWYLYNFRRPLMARLRALGHRPVAISPRDEYIDRLVAEGFDFIEFPLDAAGVNPLRELGALLRLRRLLAGAALHVAFTYTPKANIYLGLAARGLGIVHVPNVSGLGRVFIARSWLLPLVTRLYARAFVAARAVVFQNGDDRDEFVRLAVVGPERTVRVPGSGVDLQRFRPGHPAPRAPDGCTVFLFIGRVLRDKGIVEFVDAARRVRARHREAVFQVLGSAGGPNPTALPRAWIDAHAADGTIEYLGTTDDVRPAIAAADCVVLPSYREGVPRVLLEASAMGKPCITTDVPGCRDAVDAGATGLICAVRDAAALADAMERFLALPDGDRERLGRAARHKMQTQFDESAVLDTYGRLTDEIATQIARARVASPAVTRE